MVLRTYNSSTVIPEMEAEDCSPEANSGCIVSWRPALALQWESVSQNQKKKKIKEYENQKIKSQREQGRRSRRRRKKTQNYCGGGSRLCGHEHTCEALGMETLYVK